MSTQPTPTTPFIVGHRVYLRLLVLEDAELLFRWINDRNTTHYLARFWPVTFKQEREWIEKAQEQYRDKSGLALMICLKETDEPIGTMGLHNIDYKNGVAKTGAMIGEDAYRNKGLGTDAKMHLLHYAFHTLGLRKITSELIAYNEASLRYGEKCGYQKCGVRKKHILKDGTHRDLILTEVFREDWEPLWKKFRQT